MSDRRFEGVIDRRILVNYRIEPELAARHLPAPFRPQLVAGWAIGGICMIRLRDLRPLGLPPAFGLRSENVAHRFAVEWEEDGRQRQGVYIPRRDSNSTLVTLLGGRLFPGAHGRARFEPRESADRYALEVCSEDGQLRVALRGHLAERMPASSVFATPEAASDFFARGSVGYSPALSEDHYEGLELLARDWTVQPLHLDQLTSSFFDDPTRFPPEHIAFDSALLMRGIEHAWAERPAIRREVVAAPAG